MPLYEYYKGLGIYVVMVQTPIFGNHVALQLGSYVDALFSSVVCELE